MNIREEVKKYRNTKADIEQLKVEIEIIKLEKMPSNIQVISGMPLVHSNDSKIERTVLNIDEDEEIQEKLMKIKELELKLRAVDAELIRLDNEDRDFIGYYTKGTTKQELINKYPVDIDSVKVKLTRILDDMEKRYYKKSA